MEKKRIGVKDLVNIGIFAVLYFIAFFIAGITGFIPVMIPVDIVCVIVTADKFRRYLHYRQKKPGHRTGPVWRPVRKLSQCN